MGKQVTYVLPVRYSTGQIIACYKWMQAHHDAVWRSDQWTDIGHTKTVKEWFQWFRDKLDKKISSKDPRYPKDFSLEKHYNFWRLAYKINRRIIIRKHDLNGLPKKVAKRLEHLVHEEGE